MYKLLSCGTSEEMKPPHLVHVASELSINRDVSESPICTFGEWGSPSSPNRPPKNSGSFSKLLSSHLKKISNRSSFPEFSFFEDDFLKKEELLS